MSQITVTTLAVGMPWAWSTSIPVMRSWCAVQGYGFYPDDKVPVEHSRHPTWHKIPHLTHMLDSLPEESWVCWMDSDILIRDVRADLRKVIMEGDEFVIAQEAPFTGRWANSGVILAWNCPRIRDFLGYVWDHPLSRGKHAHGAYHEQSVIEKIFKRETLDFQWRVDGPVNRLNARAEKPAERARFLRHIGTPQRNRKPNVMRNYSKRCGFSVPGPLQIGAYLSDLGYRSGAWIGNQHPKWRTHLQLQWSRDLVLAGDGPAPLKPARTTVWSSTDPPSDGSRDWDWVVLDATAEGSNPDVAEWSRHVRYGGVLIGTAGSDEATALAYDKGGFVTTEGDHWAMVKDWSD